MFCYTDSEDYEGYMPNCHTEDGGTQGCDIPKCKGMNNTIWFFKATDDRIYFWTVLHSFYLFIYNNDKAVNN